jgi:hypothetical protein
LLPDDRRTEAGIQALGAKAGVGLAPAIDDGSDVLQQVGEAFFGSVSPTPGESIQADNAAVQFVHALDDRVPIPAKFLFGPPLATPTEEFHGPGHEESAVTAFQGAGRFAEVAFDILGESHGS